MRNKYLNIVFILICFLFLDVSSLYAWNISIENTRALPNHMGNYYEFVAKKDKNFPITVDAVILKKDHYKAKLVTQQWDSAASLAQLSYKKGALIAINGGFYRENFLVNGLLMIDGKRYSRFISNDLLSAIVNINDQGKVTLYAKEQYGKEPLFSAFQAGPLLYQNAQKTGLYGEKLRQRSVLVEFETGDIGLFYFSPVRLPEMTAILEKIVEKFDYKISHATNLDGGVASSFIINFDHHPVIRAESQPVKMVLLFY